MKVALRELVTIKSGDSPSTFKLAQSGSIPYVKVDDLNNCQKYQVESRAYCNDSDRTVPSGSIIFPKRGAAIMNNKVRIAATDICMDTNMMALIPNDRVSPEYLYYAVINEQLSRIADTSTIPQINNKHINPYKIWLPDIREQKAIADLLSTWDEAIEKTERLIQAKEKRLQHLSSRLINDACYPRCRIRKFATECTTRNRDHHCDRVLSVTNTNGFVLPEHQFKRRVASSDLSNYKLVRRGQYAYNPSRINVGSIARLDDWSEGVLSPMYVVFDLDGSKVNSDFFLHWLSTHEAKQRIKNSAQGSVRETVSFNDLASILFPLPSIERQAEVAALLNCVVHEIELLRKLAEKYKTQKRGLMQKLLAGRWRVKLDREVA